MALASSGESSARVTAGRRSIQEFRNLCTTISNLAIQVTKSWLPFHVLKRPRKLHRKTYCSPSKKKDRIFALRYSTPSMARSVSRPSFFLHRRKTGEPRLERRSSLLVFQRRNVGAVLINPAPPPPPEVVLRGVSWGRVWAGGWE